eukprot:1142845-Pelagomonas_calceolata.AAC.2
MAQRVHLAAAPCRCGQNLPHCCFESLNYRLGEVASVMLALLNFLLAWLTLHGSKEWSFLLHWIPGSCNVEDATANVIANV